MQKKKKYAVSSFLEILEGRTLFAAISLNGGIMNLAGSANMTNKLAVSMDSTGRLWGIADSYNSSYLPNQVSGINLTEGSTNDQYSIGADLPIAVRIYNSSGTLIQTIPAGSAATSSGSSGTSQSTPPVTNPNAPIAQITPDSATSILPGQSVFVDGLNSTLNSGTYLTTKYQWDFGDPNSQDDQLVGFNAGHAYETPGNYTITLTVTNSLGDTSVATQNVIVSPDNRQTIYVDAVNGSDSNNGSSPSQAIQSFTELSKIIQPNEIILFARGETFGVQGGLALQSGDTVDAYGTGTGPVLQYQAALTPGDDIFLVPSPNTQNVVVQNLTFDTLNPNPDGAMPDGVDAGGADVTVRDNTFLNIGDCVNANGVPDGLLVEGNSQPLQTGMSGYMIWLQGENTVIISNTSVNSTRQHNIRATGGFSNMLIENNNFSNPPGGAADPEDEVDKDTINVQYGSFAYISGNTVSDGPLRIGPLNANEIDVYPATALSERETWVVVEDNTVNDTDLEVHPGTVDGVVRNNVVNADNSTGIEVFGYDPTYQNIVQNVSFLNNTVVNNGQFGNAFWIMGQTQNVTIANNLYIAPNFEPGYYTTTSPVYVQYGNLSGLSFSNNIWPEPTSAERTWWANGGVNYMTTDLGQDGFYTEAAWNALPGVNNDVFSTVPLGVGDQATVQGVTAGANLSVVG